MQPAQSPPHGTVIIIILISHYEGQSPLGQSARRPLARAGQVVYVPWRNVRHAAITSHLWLVQRPPAAVPVTWRGIPHRPAQSRAPVRPAPGLPTHHSARRPTIDDADSSAASS